MPDTRLEGSSSASLSMGPTAWGDWPVGVWGVGVRCILAEEIPMACVLVSGDAWRGALATRSLHAYRTLVLQLPPHSMIAVVREDLCRGHEPEGLGQPAR